MSPTQQEIAALPTLNTNQSQSQMHTHKIQFSIHQICDFLPDSKPQKQFSSCLFMEPLCMALLYLSDCIQQDKAKTGGMMAPTASDQGADRAD